MIEYRKIKEPKFGFEIITPERAKQILSKSVGNRNLRKDKVTEFVKYMRKGAWVSEIGDPIRISSDGNLLDGQHRITAVSIYGKPVKFMVYYLEPSDNKGKLTAHGLPFDFGSKRSMGDITGINSKYNSITTGLIRDVAINGSALCKDPLVIANVFDKIMGSTMYVCDKCNTAERIFSQVSIKSMIVLRHLSGNDSTDDYKNVLNQKWNLLPNTWNSWIRKMQDYSTQRDGKARREIMCYTWKVTDPYSDGDKNLQIKNMDVYFDEIRKTFYSFCGDILVNNE